MSYLVEFTGDRVDAWSIRALAENPTGEMLAFRNELAADLRQLTGRGVLHATYTSADTGDRDVDNVLFFNVGDGAFANCAKSGLRFERSFAAVDSPYLHHHSYEMGSAGFLCWDRGEVVAEAPTSPLPSTDIHWIWWTIRNSTAHLTRQLTSDNFGVSITLRGPKSMNLGGKVKSLVDGVVAAFQVHDGSQIEAVGERLGERLGVAPGLITKELMNPRLNALGVRSIIHLRGRSVQWRPSDERCVAGELIYEAAPSLSISAYLFRPVPVTERAAPLAGIRQKPGFNGNILHTRLRGHGTRNWSIRREDTERLETVLGSEPFFCFDDPRGATVCVNTEYLQLARVLWDTGPEFTQWEAPKGVRIQLAGCSEPITIGAAEPEDLRLGSFLEGLVDEEHLKWRDEDGELVLVRLADLVYLEYPSEWDVPLESDDNA